jgi:hypothetical protein
MRVLVTTARMPFALGLIRRLGEAGHEVLAGGPDVQAFGELLEARLVVQLGDPGNFCPRDPGAGRV